MIGGSEVNPDQYKQQAQMLQMRGSQMVEQQTGKTAADGTTGQAKGSKKQLIGTVLGIVVVAVLLVILSNLT